MPQRIKMPNGDILTVRDGASMEAVVKEWKKTIEDEFGYDPSINADSMNQNIERRVQEANREWADKNPGKAAIASYQSGVRNLGRNVANMTGFLDDEELQDRTLQDKALSDTNPRARTLGEITPTFGLGALGRVPALARTMAAFPKTFGAVEGGAVGAALADPNERVQGAAGGAVGGAAAGALANTMARLGGGFAPPTQAARRAMSDTGVPPGASAADEVFIPVNKAGETTGQGAGATYLYDKVLPHFPAASRRMAAQVQEAERNSIQNMIRRGYRGAADKVIENWKATGRLDKALDLGDTLVNPKDTSTKLIRETLRRAASTTRHAGTPNLADIGKAARLSPKADAASVRALRETAEGLEEVLKRKVPEEGFVQARHAMYEFIRQTSNMGLFGAPSLVARGVSSKGFQKFILGSTKWQEALTRAAKTNQGRGVTDVLHRAVRNYLVASGASEDAIEKAMEMYDGA